MNQDVRYPWQILTNALANATGNLMRGSYCNFGVDLQMEVDMVFQAGLAGVTFFHSEDIGHAGRGAPDIFHGIVVRHGVHEMHARFVGNAESCRDHDEAYHKSTIMVGPRKTMRPAQSQRQR